MAIENIDKWSFRYFLLKGFGKFMHNQIFYRKVDVIGYENVPKNEPVIFAANHQNALMDALAILYNVKGQPVFLARSDIFKKSLAAKFLTFIKILPIYRIRDGVQELKKNDTVFEATFKILRNNKYLGILPEGNHAGFRKLRTLKKGIARIAFQAEEASDFSLGIKIIPVGLDYSHYSNFRSRLLVNFGKPVEVAQFTDLYKENPQKGMNELRKELAKHMKPLMLHINNDEYYEDYITLLDVLEEDTANDLKIENDSLTTKFKTRKKIIEGLDTLFENDEEKFKTLAQKATKYRDLVQKLNLRDWVLAKGKFSLALVLLRSLIYLITFPLYLYGMILNYIPYYTLYFLTRKVKDPQFVSSFRYVLSLIIFPLFYILLLVTFAIIFSKWIWMLDFMLSLPLTGIIAIHYYIGIKKLRGIIRFRGGIRKNNKQLMEAIKLRAEMNDVFSL